MKRAEFLNSITANIQDKNTIKHMLATEAIMKALAKKLGENEDKG